MQDLANLGIKVDSTSVVTANKHLDELEGKSRKVETATQSVSNEFKKLSAVVSAVAASYAALKLAHYIQEVTMLAARYETLGVVMRIVGNNAGYTGAQMEVFAKGLEKTGISMIEARQSLTRMVQANLDLAQSSKLARVAQDAAVIGNINSSEAFQRMVYGIQSGQVEILRTIGINVNFENSYQKVAKATGRASTAFSEAEKAQIRMNAVMDAGVLISGTYEAAMGTAGKQVLSLQRHVDNMKVAFGLAFTPALAEIIEAITGAITDLNGELSGDSKDKIADWGNNFRLTLISIEAEILRLSMLIDKIGGTMTSAQMLLYGPGSAVGYGPSVKRFEAAAQANIDLENRYKDSEKALEGLADKYNKIESAMTTNGKVAAKAAQDAAEKRRLGSQATAEAIAIESEATKKLREEAEKINEQLGNNIKLSGLDDLDKKLMEIQIKYEKLAKNPLVDKDLLNKSRASDESEAKWEARSKELKEELEVTQAIKKSEDDLTKSVSDGVEKSIAGIKNLQDDRIAFYDTIAGYENEAYELKLARIEEERKAYIKLYGDVGAANADASQKQIRALEEKIDGEQYWAKTVIGNFGNVIDAARDCYNEDSKEYKRLSEFKKVILVAEQAMEIAKQMKIIQGIGVQTAAAVAGATAENAANTSKAVTGAVASVTSSGSGDPYTGIARVAAMIALMAGVLSIIGVGFSPGSGSDVAAQPPAMGNSTVLGAAYGTGSESISNTLELLQDTYDLEDTKLTKIYNELKNLNSNISGLVSTYLRTGSMDGFSSKIPTYDRLTGAATTQEKFMDLVSGRKITDAVFGKDTPIGNIVNFLFGKGLQIFSSLYKNMFGGEITTVMVSSGIKIGKTLIESVVNGMQIDAKQFALYAQKTSGGYFGKDKMTAAYVYNDLDESVVNLLSNVYQGMGVTLVELAKGLGTDVNKVLEYSFGEIKLNLKGKNGEEISKLIQEKLSAIGDTAVEDLFGSAVSQYQKINEGLLETAVRLIIDKESVLSILRDTNQSFDGTTSELISFSEALISVAGSLDQLTEAFQTYYDAFFSDAEKQADLKSQLSGALGMYGYSLPGQRSGYRELVESLNLTTEAGQAAYVALMQMSKGADEYYDYLEKAKGDIRPENYSTALEYRRALAGFADGGISAGPESGYEAMLHGTELIVSPRKGYPATVVNGDSAELVAEVRALRAELKQNFIYSQSNSDRIVRNFDRWEAIGLPSERA